MTLSADLLIHAYTQGLFPMAEPNGQLHWYRPDPRGILPLENFHCPDSLRRSIRAGHYQIHWNRAFPAVLQGCANREETWLNQEIAQAVLHLHQRGLAHSVEAWDHQGLAGGLYGISLGGAFFGESMFSTRRDASKHCLAALVQRMTQTGHSLLDCQWSTPHLKRFGVIEIPAAAYHKQLQTALNQTPAALPPTT